MSDYTVYICTETGNSFKKVGVFKSYDSAIRYTDDNPLRDGQNYSVWCTDYDGKEPESYPMY